MAITYADKVQNAVNPLPVTKQWRAVDANEVKNEVNANITATAAAQAAADAAQSTANAAGTAAVTAQGDIDNHEALTNNPHNVTKSQVGLSNVPNLLFSGSNTGDQDLSGLQPLDSDLTAIAGLAPSNDDFIQRKVGVWTNRTPTQVRADLTALQTYAAWTPSYTGFSGTPTATARFTVIGKVCFAYINMTASVSNATGFTFSLPVQAANTSNQLITAYVVNNGTPGVGLVRIDQNLSTATVFRDMTGTAFTSSGTKLVSVILTYETI